ncbi:MAG: hypothetical protein AAF713_19990 [Pseudomonadota bacterium]
MTDARIIGIDIAKRVFQLHGAGADGQVTFRKTVSRGQLVLLLKKYPTCLVAMEACATAHRWGRYRGSSPPIYGAGVGFHPRRTLIWSCGGASVSGQSRRM